MAADLLFRRTNLTLVSYVQSHLIGRGSPGPGACAGRRAVQLDCAQASFCSRTLSKQQLPAESKQESLCYSPRAIELFCSFSISHLHNLQFYQVGYAIFTMNTLIFGHSFTHRLNAFLQTPPGSRPLPNTQQHNITCIGKGGSYLSGSKYDELLHQVHTHLSNNHIHVLIICLGTNDLDSGMTPENVAWRLYLLAAGLQITYHIRSVFVEQILYRDTVQFPGFRQRAAVANAKLEALITQGGNKCVKFWKHHNFNNPRRRILCRDGVHLNQVGMTKYWHSLRGAIFYGEPHQLR